MCLIAASSRWDKMSDDDTGDPFGRGVADEIAMNKAITDVRSMVVKDDVASRFSMGGRGVG